MVQSVANIVCIDCIVYYRISIPCHIIAGMIRCRFAIVPFVAFVAGCWPIGVPVRGFKPGGFRLGPSASVRYLPPVPRSTFKPAINALQIRYLDPNGAPPANLSRLMASFQSSKFLLIFLISAQEHVRQRMDRPDRPPTQVSSLSQAPPV